MSVHVSMKRNDLHVERFPELIWSDSSKIIVVFVPDIVQNYLQKDITVSKNDNHALPLTSHI